MTTWSQFDASATRRRRAGALLATAALLAGLVLGALGQRFGPLAVLGAPAVLLYAGWALRAPWAAMALVPAALPWGDTLIGGGVLPLSQGVALIAVGLVVLSGIGGRRLPFTMPAPGWWMLLLVVQLVLATPGAASLALASRQDATIVIGMLVALGVCVACRSASDLRRLVGLILLAGGVVCARGLATSGTVSAQANAAVVQGSNGIFSEHNQAGSVSAAVFVLAIAAAFASRTWWGRGGAVLVALVSLAQLGLSLSRGAYIGALIGVIVLFVLQARVRRALLLVALPLVLLGVAAAALTPSSAPLTIVGERLATISSPGNNPYDDRPAIWAEAVREFEEAPWLGQGPGSFPVVSTRSASRAQTVSALHAHNVLLTVAAEDGGPAVLALVGLTIALGIAVRRGVTNPARGPAMLAAGSGAALCTFAAQGLVDVTLRNSTISQLAWLLAGVAMASANQARRAQVPL